MGSSMGIESQILIYYAHTCTITYMMYMYIHIKLHPLALLVIQVEELSCSFPCGHVDALFLVLLFFQIQQTHQLHVCMPLSTSMCGWKRQYAIELLNVDQKVHALLPLSVML